MSEFTFEQCNAKNFAWFNKKLNDYPSGTRELQYHKSKNFALVTHLDLFHVQQMIDCFYDHDLTHYAYIRHIDSDFEHYHILLEFRNAILCRSVVLLVNMCANIYCDNAFRDVTTTCEYFEPKSNVTQYIVHESYKARLANKAKYDWKEVVSDDVTYWQDFSSRGVSTRNVDTMFTDIANGMSMFELACKYGRDFIINHEKYLSFYVKYVKSELLDASQYETDEQIKFKEDVNHGKHEVYN